MRKTHIRSAMLCVTAIGLATATQVSAQTVASQAPAPAATPDTTAPEVAQEATVETSPDIVVTGSRLGQSGFSAPTPVTVLGTAQIDTRAPANIGDFLNEQPAFRNSQSPTQGQRTIGGGALTLDLRGLGSTRTLTLVNGQRFTPTLRDGTLDVSMIPTLLVDRVDIVTGGASAAYGSDAVAGVVNFVLNDRLTGVRAKAQYNVSEEGDNQGPIFSLAAGTSFSGGRGHIIVGGEYADNKGVGRIYERAYGRNQPGLIANGAARPAGTPASSFVNDVTYSAQTPGGLITAGPLRGTAFGVGGTPFAFQYGTVFSTLMVGGNSYGNSPFGNWPIVTPTERMAALTRLSYEIGDETEIFAEANYGKNIARGYTSYNQRSFVINRANPFLPTTVRDAMIANNLQTVTVARLFTENGGLQQENTRETYRGLLGVKGKIFGDWQWDAAAQYGRSTSREVIFQNILGANYDAAVNAVQSGGQIVCGPFATNPNLNAAKIAALTPGCVPINIFGYGSPSTAAIDYITEDSLRTSAYTRLAGAANLRGSPFATWAGPVQVAVGAEYRRDRLVGKADPLSAAGLFTSGNSGIYRGSQKVTEGFAEVGVPLAADTSFARSLDVNAAYRYTHYSTSGSVSTWKLGLTYAPLDAIRLRVTRSRDIRAPNLSELYVTSPSGVSTASFVNPFNGRSGPLNASSVGNTDLSPEKADTLTGGIVLTPTWDWAKGFRFSVDGYRIKVKDVITNLAANDVVARCFAGATSFCGAITFDNTTFGIANVARRAVNLAALETTGLDIEAQYRFALSGVAASLPGAINLRVLATKVFTLKTTDDQGTVDRAGSLQNSGIPSWTGNANIDFISDVLNVNLNARYVSASTFDVAFVGPDSPNYNPAAANSINLNRFPAAVYFNLNTAIKIKQGDREFQLFGGVDNLFDKQPPQYAAIGINSGGDPYDLIGRRYQIGVRANF